MLDLPFLNALWLCERMTAERLRQIRAYFPSFETACTASSSDFIEAGIKPEIATQIYENLTQINPEAEWKKLEKLNLKLIPKDDAHYPALLREIPGAPELLYIKGDCDLSKNLMTVVGSRSLTAYGQQAVEKIVEPLAREGIVIVSGLALGADGAAHKAALKAQGQTIAVLANGLDTIYPATHTHLAEQLLAQGGALISEYPLGVKPLRQRFPARNRIVAGLSQATLIIEAALKSGSLITAQMALDFGREVFALLGSIFARTSQGTNNLIQTASAQLVSDPQDILSFFGIDRARESQTASRIENPLEAQIFQLLSHEPLSSDFLAQKTQLTPAEVASALTMLEMRGQVRNLGGGLWVRNN